jgi:hypothetical protein
MVFGMPLTHTEKKCMGNNVVVALIALFGTLLGTFGGIVTSSKLTNYRLAELEKKVDKHNNFAERIPVLEEQLRLFGHQLDDMEEAKNC